MLFWLKSLYMLHKSVVLVGTSRKVLDDVYQSLLNIFRTDHTNKILKFKNLFICGDKAAAFYSKRSFL